MRRRDGPRGTFYLKLLLSYLVVLVLALAVMSAFYYFNTVAKINAKYQQDYAGRFAGVSSMIDGKLLAMANVGAKLSLLPVVHQYAAATPADLQLSAEDIRAMTTTLDEYNMSLEVTSGIGVLFPRTDVVFSNFGHMDIRSYLGNIYRLSGTDVDAIMGKLNGYSVLAVLPPMTPTVFKGMGRELIPVLKSIDFESQTPRAYALFFLDVDRLTAYVGLPEDGTASLFFDYEEGTLAKIDANPLPEAALRGMLSSASDQRPVVSARDGVRFLFRSRYVPVSYRFHLARSPYLADAAASLVFMLLVSLVVLGTGVPLAVSLLNRSYRPLQHLVTSVFRGGVDDPRHVDEFDLIEQEISRMQVSKAATDSKLQTWAGYVHGNLLGNLVKNRLSDSVLDSLLPELGLDGMKGRPFTLLVMKPVPGAAAATPQQGLPFYSSDVILRVIDALKAVGSDLGMDIRAFESDKGFVTALAFAPDGVAPSADGASALAARVKDQLMKYQDNPCMVGYSDEACILGDTARPYHAARRMVEFFAFTGLDGQEGVERFNGYRKFYYEYSIAQQKQLEYGLRRGNDQAVLDLLRDIKQKNFANDSLSFDALKRLILDLADTGMRAAGRMNLHVEWAERLYPDFRENMTQDQMWHYLEELFAAICREARTLGEGAEDEPLVQLVEYVNANFTNPSLSLKDLSARFNLPDYTISRRFKLITEGSNFLDYLTLKRILLAKQYLESTDFRIDDVAVKVGFENIATFRRLFKKREGISPSEYRELSKPG